jgi:hypothetical protein
MGYVVKHCPAPPVAADFHPHGPWSLWDMLKKYAAGFMLVTNQLRNMGDAIAEMNEQRDPTGKGYRVTVTKGADGKPVNESVVAQQLLALREGSSQVPCKSFSAQVDRIAHYTSDNFDPRILHSQFEELLRRLEDDLNDQYFFYVIPERVKFYTEKNLFGDEAPEKLPEIIDDLESGGQCLALGQGTACVFHMMRVMEAGLKRLASMLGIPYAPSWESYIRQITSRIEQKHKSGLHPVPQTPS